MRAFRHFLLAGSLAGLVVPGPTWHAAVRTGSVEGTVRNTDGAPLAGAMVDVQGTTLASRTDAAGNYRISNVPAGKVTIRVRMLGYASASQAVTIADGTVVRAEFKLAAMEVKLDEIVAAAAPPAPHRRQLGKVTAANSLSRDMNTEEYHAIVENAWKSPLANPLSTFSSDVDAASYSNVRRFLVGGTLPPKDAVRVEEMINYFHYDYPEPRGDAPVSITTEVSTAPWNANHKLMLIGLQTRRIPMADLPPNNLVFLLDVSGSMADAEQAAAREAGLPVAGEPAPAPGSGCHRGLRRRGRAGASVDAGRPEGAGSSTPSTGSRPAAPPPARQGIRLAYQTARQAMRAEGQQSRHSRHRR